MANNDTRFSEKIPWMKDREKEERWWDCAVGTMRGNKTIEGVLPPKLLEAIKKDPDQWESVADAFTVEEEGVWVYDDGGTPDLHNIGAVVQQYLLAFGDEDSEFAMAWACVCARPIAGEFGGGAMLVTRDFVDTMWTGECLDLMRDRAKMARCVTQEEIDDAERT